MLEKKHFPEEWHVKCDHKGCKALFKSKDWCHATAVHQALEAGWTKQFIDGKGIVHFCPKHSAKYCKK